MSSKYVKFICQPKPKTAFNVGNRD